MYIQVGNEVLVLGGVALSFRSKATYLTTDIADTFSSGSELYSYLDSSLRDGSVAVLDNSFGL